MFNQYDFDYTDSKNESLVQLADFMGGSIYKSLSDAASPDYLEMLKGKVMAIGEFPKKSVPFFAIADQNDKVYDRDIYELAINFIREEIKIIFHDKISDLIHLGT